MTARDSASRVLDIASESGDLDPEVAGMLRAFIPGMDENALSSLLLDAARARALLDTGDREGALAIVEPYREMARDAGLEPLFDVILSDISAE